MEIDLGDLRLRMLELFDHGNLARLALSKQFRQMLAGPMPVSTADVADLAAFYLLDDLAIKQELLADTDLRRRVERTVHALQSLIPSRQLCNLVPTAQIEYSLKHPDMN